MSEEKSQILYVDDEVINLRNFKALFRRKYKIFTAISGKEALTLLETEHIDVLVTDQMMPEMTGIELLKIVNKQYPDILLMILTGYSEMSVIKEAINECGIYCYLNKPWEKELLERTFERALEHQNLIREREKLIVLLNQHNEELEVRVDERTQEVEAQKEEIQHQHQELLQKQEEITRQRDQLMTQNHLLADAKELIDKKNDQLQAYNQDLELQVARRTEQLTNSNLRLLNHTDKLEQFAFLAAHNFRGPVATLLGLIQLFEVGASSGIEDYQDIFGKIKEVALNLDTVIRDLSSIIHHEEDTKEGVQFEDISFSSLLSKVENALNAQISEKKATVTKNVVENDHILTNKDALEHILYQLISNAIKFNPPGNAPEIRVEVHRNTDTVQISIQDNGLGIDLDRYGDKVFGVYQRFHEGFEGKGLGLFSVKSQVYRIGGQIIVESRPDMGSKFTIILPVEKLEYIDN